MGRQAEIDLLRVAAADVEVVVVEQGVQDGDDVFQARIPFLAPDLLEFTVAEILVVSPIVVDRMMCQLQMRRDLAVTEEGTAEPGAEGDNELEALALDDRQ